jgi:polyisoprenyl-phosphate glycosyltransferase
VSRVAQPVGFVLVGAGGYVVNLGVFTALVGSDVAYPPASIAGFLAANALMYFANRYFTFRLGHDELWRMYLRYLVVGSVVAGLNAALLASIVEGAGADPRLGQALSLAALTPVAFALSKRWTFQLRVV